MAICRADEAAHCATARPLSPELTTATPGLGLQDLSVSAFWWASPASKPLPTMPSTKGVIQRISGIGPVTPAGKGGIMGTCAGSAGPMHSRIKMTLKTLLLGLACTMATTLTLAQTTPVKPAAKPTVKPTATAPADGKTLSLSGGSGTAAVRGPLLTREELRSCLKQEESLRTRLAALDAGRAPLDQEKQAITADQLALRAERAPLDDVKKKSEEFALRLKDFSARVQSWQERVEAHNSARPAGSTYDRNQAQLKKDREEIEKERLDLEIERLRLSASGEEVVRTYNAKAQALDERVTAWNARNSAWNETTAALDAERKGWVSSCADRRYREDDETAIRQGK